MAENKPGFWTKQGYALAAGPVGMWGKALNRLGALTDEELKYFQSNRAAALDDNGAGMEDVTEFASNMAADPLSYIPMGKAKGLWGVAKRGLQGAAMGGADELIRSGGDTGAALKAAKTGGLVSGGLNVAGQLGGKTLRALAPDASEVLSRQAIADKAGVKPTLGDLLPEGSGVKTFEEVGEQIPFSGMKAKRAAQAQALRQTADRVKGGLDRNAKGGSVPQMLANRKQYLKEQATKLYDKVDDLERQYRDPSAWNKATGHVAKIPEVDLTPVRSTAKKLISEASGAIDPDAEIVNKLKPYAQARNRSFSEVRASMTNLNDDIAKAKDNPKLKRALMQVKESLRGANDAWGEGQTGEIKKAYDEATQFYAKNIGPWKEPLGRQLTEGAKGAMTGEKAAKTMYSGMRDYSGAAKLWDTLDQPTKDATIMQMVGDAFEDAGRDGVVEPGKLARGLRKLVEKAGSENPMFNQDSETLLGLAKTIEMFPRASQYWVNPPTGNRLQRWMTPLAAGGVAAGQAINTGIASGGATLGLGGAALTGAGVLGGAAMASRLLDSEASKKVLRVIAKAKASDPLIRQMAAKLMQQAASVPPRLGPMNRERINEISGNSGRPGDGLRRTPNE